MDNSTAFQWIIVAALAARAAVELILCAIEAPAIFAALKREACR